MSAKPYLSLVVASRNDDHGGNTLYRTQIFIDSFLEQCERHRLRAELIIVEWNPPSDRPPLAEVIDWRRQNSWVDCRVITVPYERHIFLRFARVLPLFQMIAKNVGIRRAQGEFILATNIDILFSEELMTILAKKMLLPDRQYRCDRFDVDSSIPKDVSLEEKLQFAREHLVQCHHRMRLPKIAALQAKGAPLKAVINAALETGMFETKTEGGISTLTAKQNVPVQWLHLDACGDFALLHKNAWEKMRGYPEFEMFSLNLDSIGLITAHRLGFRETWFPPPAVCYHIEHTLGSGYNPKNPTPMFKRLEKQGIGWVDFALIKPFLTETDVCHFNTEEWGLQNIPLDETFCTRTGLNIRKVPDALRADPYAPVSALRPEFSADQYFRRALQQQREQIASRAPNRIIILRERIRAIYRRLITWWKKNSIAYPDKLLE